jgi:hypothetical protein
MLSLVPDPSSFIASVYSFGAKQTVYQIDGNKSPLYAVE